MDSNNSQYDITRSNRLSTEIMKIYLYDIACLGKVKNDMLSKKQEMQYEMSGLGKKRTYNSLVLHNGYFPDLQSCFLQYFGILIFVCVLSIIYGIFGKGKLHDDIIPHLGVTGTIALILIIPLVFVFIGIIREKNEYSKAVEEDNMKREAFEQGECRRLDEEKRLAGQLSKKIYLLNKNLVEIDEELQKLYQQNILHKDYQDPFICGIMYQLFDTGRVSNLTEAMNLYEELMWRDEMKQMLSAISNKMDRLLEQQGEMLYFSKCIMSNQQQVNRLMQGICMDQKRILSNQNAIEMNIEVIEANTRIVGILSALNYIDSQK